MDLSTRYLGFALPHPLIPGSCPMADNLDRVRRLADAGAPMIVMRSIFAEQIAIRGADLSDRPVRLRTIVPHAHFAEHEIVNRSAPQGAIRSNSLRTHGPRRPCVAARICSMVPAAIGSRTSAKRPRA